VIIAGKPVKPECLGLKTWRHGYEAEKLTPGAEDCIRKYLQVRPKDPRGVKASVARRLGRGQDRPSTNPTTLKDLPNKSFVAAEVVVNA